MVIEGGWKGYTVLAWCDFFFWGENYLLTFGRYSNNRYLCSINYIIVMDEKNKDIKSNHDFGYPHTLEELETALDNADAQRNDPSKWISSVEFHTRLENKYPWLR